MLNVKKVICFVFALSLVIIPMSPVAVATYVEPSETITHTHEPAEFQIPVQSVRSRINVAGTYVTLTTSDLCWVNNHSAFFSETIRIRNTGTTSYPFYASVAQSSNNSSVHLLVPGESFDFVVRAIEPYCVQLRSPYSYNVSVGVSVITQ